MLARMITAIDVDLSLLNLDSPIGAYSRMGTYLSESSLGAYDGGLIKEGGLIESLR